jgi:flavin reductase (DIM6/NTAB) family NADH-FMN oxidoreductase RutF
VTNIEVFRQARYFGISILREDQWPVSERFAQKGHDRFDGIAWFAGETGAPLLSTALATLECATHQNFTSGDHDILIGQVVNTSLGAGSPLIYYASQYRKLTFE